MTKKKLKEAPEAERLPFTPEDAIERLREVLRMLESVTDDKGRVDARSPLPKARVYLRGIIGCGIALVREGVADYNAAIQAAVHLVRSEYSRAPEAARLHDSVWMGGYEDACDHLSAEIEKLRDPKLPLPDLEWAAQWIEGSLTGERSAEVIRFAKNMAMTLRAAMIPPPLPTVTPQPGWKPDSLANQTQKLEEK